MKLSPPKGPVLAAFLAGSLLAAHPVAGGPIPSITANNSNNRIMIMPSMFIDIAVSLDTAGLEGTNADWWLYADTDFGTYYYDATTFTWLPGLHVTYQAPLTAIPPSSLLSGTGLPAGTYTFTFGVDTSMNGILDSSAALDKLTITIPGYDCTENASTSLDALSATQQSFIVSRGNPDFFTLGFVSEDVSSSGHAMYATSIRRIESWAYNSSQLTNVLFDNGNYIKESTLGNGNSSLQSTNLSPSMFTHCMGRDDIIKIMGEPSCTQSETMGGKVYSYMRYNPSATAPAATVVLENGVLVTVTAGYSFTYAGSASTDLCAAQ